MSDTAEEIKALKEATREAHEAIQSLRDVIKEARAVKSEIEVLAIDIFDKKIHAQVRVGLEDYRNSIDTAIENATAAVYDRFNKITDILLGETKKSKARGDSLQQLAEKRQR